MNKMINRGLFVLCCLLSAGYAHAMQPATSLSDAFYKAIDAGNLSAVEQSIKKDPSLVNKAKDARTVLPLCSAVISGHEDIVGLLIAHGASVNPDDDISPLFCAINNNNVNMARLLLDNGASANSRDGATVNYLYSPLFCAVQRGFVAMVQLLLQYGTSIDQCDGSGRTPLDLAQTYGNTKIINLLEQARQLRQNAAIQTTTSSLRQRKGAQSSAE